MSLIFIHVGVTHGKNSESETQIPLLCKSLKIKFKNWKKDLLTDMDTT